MSRQGANDDALITAAGGPYTVTSHGDTTVASVATAKTAILEIDSDHFTATMAPAPVRARTPELSTSKVGRSANLAGVLNNTGTIKVDSDANFAELQVISNLTLKGAGKLLMDNQNNTAIASDGSHDVTLTNVDNIISPGRRLDRRRPPCTGQSGQGRDQRQWKRGHFADFGQQQHCHQMRA